jgi:hypothetical protein
MASTFKFHSQVNETVPWQAQYTFPTQATRVNKQIVKLPPKNGSSFTAGNIVRIEFPADNYLNVLNSVLSFDLTPTFAVSTLGLPKQGAHSLIKRLRILYGSLVLEDIQEYSTLVRIFTDLGVQPEYTSSVGAILDGMGSSNGIGLTSATPRSFCLNLLSGLLTCKKLIPLKWMAAQFAIEITLNSGAEAFVAAATTTGGTYTVDNVNFIAEMLEFDSTYDTAFYAGLVQGGVPLKFSSWHYHTTNVTNAITSAQIHERSRSVKAGFAVIRQNNTTVPADANIFFNSLSSLVETDNVDGRQNGRFVPTGNGALTEFQWRVGGRYYPSQPVSLAKGAPEALVESLKTINSLGDYRMASTLTPTTWGGISAAGAQEGRATDLVICSEFENTDVMPDAIAGINAEEQSDINLTIKAAQGPSGSQGGFKLDIFMHYDCLLIVRDGNVVDLVM